MKRRLLKLICLSVIVLTAHSAGAQTTGEKAGQTSYRNQVGIQFNPYLNADLFSGFLAQPVFGVRYARQVTPHFSTGPEVNGFFPVNLGPGSNLNFFRLGVGAFARYTFFTESRVRVFAEVLPYYSYDYWAENQWLPESRESKFGICLSPGISLYSRSRKFSVDLYMKFSNIEFVNGKNYVFSYKVNYHF